MTPKDKDSNKIKHNEIQQIASARTLVALREMSPNSRTQVMTFLSDAGLVDKIPLIRANLKEADLRYLWLKNGNLQNADLANAKLDDAVLEGANLNFIDSYEGASFKNATYNECTTFPEGFDPTKKEMRKEERTSKEIEIEGKCRYAP